MKALLNIVAALLLLVKSYKVQREQKDAQKQADEISENPTDWFNTHFGGVSDTDKADAGKATHLLINSEQSDVHESTGRK